MKSPVICAARSLSTKNAPAGWPIYQREICNKCGKEIRLAGGVLEEDMLEVEKRWGYFSGKDNRRDRFELCEECYDELLESFLIPAESEEC